MGDGSRRRRIVVVGSVNMDLVARCDTLPRPGETVAGTDFTTNPGGKGANQAVAAARAGGDAVAVTMVGAVGDDAFADALLARLCESGVGTDRVRRVAGPSGIAQIAVDGKGENAIVVIPGANDAMTRLTDDELAVVRGADLLMLQLEIPLPCVTQAARAARDAGVPVLLNPSPVAALPADLGAALTLAVVNEGEAAQLGATLGDVPVVVTTLGSRGARHLARGRAVEVESPQVVAVDTTGAGDAFTGALAVAYLEDRDPQDALRFACAAGAQATTVPGVFAPRREHVESLAAATYR